MASHNNTVNRGLNPALNGQSLYKRKTAAMNQVTKVRNKSAWKLNQGPLPPTRPRAFGRSLWLIIAFYAEQVELIRTELERIQKTVWWADGVAIRAVGGAQGDEADIFIVDQVRSTGLGFTGEHARMNVAYSRARKLTITVHNFKAMSGKGKDKGKKPYKKGEPVLDDLFDIGDLFNIDEWFFIGEKFSISDYELFVV
ncbi:MFS monocarboxylate transporter [Apiospora phragmitis]|uniref:MFS monocarboxylate transporter n=1 Tax=Apiospora phragmitis TaxID=2905665 RepID=A0ABR1T4Z7_9PEZI